MATVAWAAHDARVHRLVRRSHTLLDGWWKLLGGGRNKGCLLLLRNNNDRRPLIQSRRDRECDGVLRLLTRKMRLGLGPHRR